MDYEINEDYFSFIRNKIEEANEEILDYRRFCRRSFDLNKINIDKQILKLKNKSHSSLMILESKDKKSSSQTTKSKICKYLYDTYIIFYIYYK